MLAWGVAGKKASNATSLRSFGKNDVEQLSVLDSLNKAKKYRVDCFLGDAQRLDLAVFTLIYCRPNLLTFKVCFISIYWCQLRFSFCVFAKEDPLLCTSLLSYFLSPACALLHDGVNHLCKPGLEAFSCLSREKKYNYFHFKGGKTAFCC